MNFREKMQPIALTLFGLLTCVPSMAEPLVAAGNAIIRPAALEKLIRGTIADALDGRVSNSGLSFALPAISESVVLPTPTGTLKEILDILGIQGNLALGIAPIQANFTLPDSGLKVDIQNRATNSFLITAKWSLTQLSAKSSTLAIKVPAGMFDRGFEIHSSPVTIALKPGSVPVQFDVSLIADLTENGAKVRLQSFHTNLTAANHPNFSIKLGQLTVDGQPLELQIQSNGQSLNASEPTIRAEFQKLESSYADTVRVKLAEIIQSQATIQSRAITNQPAFKYDTSTDELMANLSMNNEVKKLLGGIDLSFVFSFLQSVPSVSVYSTQISSKICFDGQCLSNLGPVSPVGPTDLRAMKPTDDVSVVVYESLLQSVVHSAAFEKRIATYYKNSNPSAGVGLSPAGVKVFLDPATNSILAILNLEIDIKKVSVPGNNFRARWTRFTHVIGDWIEANWGSGKVVKIPVAINLKLAGLVRDARTGETNLEIETSFPAFNADGSFTASPRCAASVCPNNVPDMTDYVRDGFLPSVQAEVEKMLPEEIKIPMGTAVKFKTFAFQPKNVVVTTNHGLMLTAGMKTGTTGAR